MTPQVRILSVACATAGVLMIVGGVAGHSSDPAPHGQFTFRNGVAAASAGEFVEVPVTMAVQSRSAAELPVTPGPVDSHPAQQPPGSQQPPIQPGPPDGGAGFYQHCPQAHNPGTPPNRINRPEDHPPLARDNGGKPCQD
jgi:hypothetical protein